MMASSFQRNFSSLSLVLFSLLILGTVDGCTSDKRWALDLSSFETPPDDVRPIARWWWPGGSVSKEQLSRELTAFRDAGFGGVEIQPFTFGLNADELVQDPSVFTVGTPAFMELMAYALEEGKRQGLQMDVTLGSGWPGGGPWVGDDRAEELLLNWYDVDGGEGLERAPPPVGERTYVAQVQQIIDALKSSETESELVAVTATRLVQSSNEETPSAAASDVVDLTSLVIEGTLKWEVPEGRWRIFSLSRSKVGHVAVGAAYPQTDSPSWVFDHMSHAGVDSFLEGYGAGLMTSVGDSPPNSLFVDSFELLGQLPWTNDFLAEFENAKGYDLTPYLPFVFMEGGETKYGNMFQFSPSLLFSTGVGARVREDYEDIRAHFFLARCIRPLQDFAREQGASLRLQAHGGYGHVLDGYAVADIPESEGLYAGGTFDFLKLASSAAHVAGRPLVTSESFVSVSLDNTILSEEDFYLLSARAYAAGINRLVFHGFAYDYPTRDGRRWYPFSPDEDRVSAGPLRISTEFSESHSMWSQLEAFNLYLARLSYAMTAGVPVTTVAWLMADHEIPDGISLTSGGIEGKAGESDLSSLIRGRGFDYDRISPTQLLGSSVSGESLRVGQVEYSVLLIDNLDAAEPEWLEQILEIQRSGVPVIWVGKTPTRARGYQSHQTRDQRVGDLMTQLEEGVVPVTVGGLGKALEQTFIESPVVSVNGGWLRVSTVVRKTPAGYIVALCNEYNSPLEERVGFQLAHEEAQLLNPKTGKGRVVDGSKFAVTLPAGECELLITR